jgi:hypothetical protein
MNTALRDELLALATEDQRVRAELAADGSLFDGYHPRMEDVHRRNAARLKKIIEEHGWPGRSLVGEDGAEAACLVLHHAIGEPPLQRRGLQLLREAAAAGEVAVAHAAMLEDRIAFFEGQPQRYGTQLDWDEQGVLSPHPVEDISGVDERRRAVGLPPLAEAVRLAREGIAACGEGPPGDWKERRRSGPGRSGGGTHERRELGHARQAASPSPSPRRSTSHRTSEPVLNLRCLPPRRRP